VVYDILKELDPEGMEMRLKKTCKRRVFWTIGPNHIWAADGHDKLNCFGITVYGFIDAWSRKVLGIFVHVTNNYPRHIGV
jgi:transposase InsO family protein